YQRLLMEEPLLFVCAMVTLGIECGQRGIMPDYLDEPIRQLGDISSQLTGIDLECYQHDNGVLQELLDAPLSVVEAPCPPDFFPGTWRVNPQTLAWWDSLLQGKPSPT
ncbi:MAG: hypothetical protein FWG08_00700, partial [Propionibacteriaceae bacterium]|nr:hypothetical protein [Propionibacteriaceae bacterium]